MTTAPPPPHRSPRRQHGRARRLLGAVAAATIVTVALGVTGPAVADDGSRAGDGNGLRPVTECVVVNGDGSFTAFFGYEHRGRAPMDVPRGERNRVNGARGESPTTFAPGRQVAVFSATTRGPRVTWRLGAGEAVATPESQPCSTNPSVPEAPVTVLLLLAPALITAWWMRRRERLAFG